MNYQAIEKMDHASFGGRTYVTGSGISTAWKIGHQMGATPDGRRRGQSLSVSLGPSPGMACSGPTAMLNSVAKLDWHEQAGGALTHMQLPYTGSQSPTNAGILAALVSTFFRRGGMGLHVSVVDAQMLREARRAPEKHLNLLVRLGGFSAPFVQLSPEIQESIIRRAEHGW
jgi:formate C-acetyltransferase